MVLFDKLFEDEFCSSFIFDNQRSPCECYDCCLSKTTYALGEFDSFLYTFLYISLYSEIVEMYYGNYIIFYWLYTGKYTHTLQVLLLRKKKRYEIIAVILWSCDIFTLIFSTLLQAPESWLDQMHPIDKSVSYVYFTSEQIIETLSIGGK